MNKWIQIFYSWGDQEEPVPVPKGEDAWEFAKKLAVNEADIEYTERPEDGEVGLQFFRSEGEIVLHYPHDDEYCHFLITDERDYDPDSDDFEIEEEDDDED